MGVCVRVWVWVCREKGAAIGLGEAGRAKSQSAGADGDQHGRGALGWLDPGADAVAAGGANWRMRGCWVDGPGASRRGTSDKHSECSRAVV